MTPINPTSIAAPFGGYAHGALAATPGEMLFTSGQLGMAPDGATPEDAGAQAAICFANIAAILAEAGMGPEHVLRVNAFVTDRAYFPAYMTARDAFFAHLPRKPASTLVIAAGFTRPEFKVEVEATALKPAR